MATSIRPHTASHTSRHLASSPTRPQTSHSTIRRVTPSPDLEPASQEPAAQCSSQAATQGRSINTNALDDEPRVESPRPWTASIFERRSSAPQRPNLARSLTPTRIPQPKGPVSTSVEGVGLRRNHADRISPTKRAAPRKHRRLSSKTPLASNSESRMPSVTPPLGSTPCQSSLGESQAKNKSFTIFPADDPFVTSTDSERVGSHHNNVRVSPVPALHQPLVRRKPIPSSPSKLPSQRPTQLKSHAVEPFQHATPTRTADHDDSRTLTSFPQTDRKTSVISVQSTFSTPGRDEMERKRGTVEGFADEGPFGQAKDIEQLKDKRNKIVGEGKTVKLGRTAGKDGQKETGCGCLVM